jgi:hypothetical protein
VTYPSIGNFVEMQKKYFLRVQIGKNKPSEPKNGIWVPKLVFSCDISIDRKFCEDEEKIYFEGSKRQK